MLIQTKMCRLYRKVHRLKCHFFYINVYIFVWIQHGCLTNMDPSNNVIKRLWCTTVVTIMMKIWALKKVVQS